MSSYELYTSSDHCIILLLGLKTSNKCARHCNHQVINISAKPTVFDIDYSSNVRMSSDELYASSDHCIILLLDLKTSNKIA